MLNKLKALFQAKEEETPVSREQSIRLACAALMIEVATIDTEFSDSEREALHAQLSERFSLNEDELKSLSDIAEAKREDATSLHQFTKEINDHCSDEEKFTLVHSMWEIAYADGHLDKYEEHIIRRVAELIYLTHSDFIRAKLLAKN